MAAAETKRLKLEAASPAAGDGGLADVLSRLADALRGSGSGQAEGLDGLLDELGRLQIQLNGTSDQAFKAIADAQEKLQVRAGRRPAAAAAAARLPPPPPLIPTAACCWL